MTDLPAPDPAEGQAAASQAAAARRDFSEALSNGEMSLLGLFEMAGDETANQQTERPAGHMHIRAALLALPKIGEKTADRILSEVGIQGDRHIDSIGTQQRDALTRAVSDAQA